MHGVHVGKGRLYRRRRGTVSSYGSADELVVESMDEGVVIRNPPKVIHDSLVLRLSTLSKVYSLQHHGGVEEGFRREITPEDDINEFFSAKDPLIWQYLENYALGIFSLQNPIRRACVHCLYSSMFSWFIFFSICVNAILLAMDNPLSSKGDEFFATAEFAFNILFSVEFVIKLIALSGFGKIGGYFRDPWNRLDFAVLVVSWIPMLFSGSLNFSFIRIMRSFKVMKTFNNVPGLKRMVALFANVVPKMASLVYLLAFVFLFFGIFGKQLFQGALRQHCFPLEAYEIINGTAQAFPPSDYLCTLDGKYSGGLLCPGSTPKCSAYYPLSDDAIANPIENKYLNFDNTLFSFLSIFVVISLEGMILISMKYSEECVILCI